MLLENLNKQQIIKIFGYLNYRDIFNFSLVCKATNEKFKNNRICEIKNIKNKQERVKYLISLGYLNIFIYEFSFLDYIYAIKYSCILDDVDSYNLLSQSVISDFILALSIAKILTLLPSKYNAINIIKSGISPKFKIFDPKYKNNKSLQYLTKHPEELDLIQLIDYDIGNHNFTIQSTRHQEFINSVMYCTTFNKSDSLYKLKYLQDKKPPCEKDIKFFVNNIYENNNTLYVDPENTRNFELKLILKLYSFHNIFNPNIRNDVIESMDEEIYILYLDKCMQYNKFPESDIWKIIILLFFTNSNLISKSYIDSISREFNSLKCSKLNENSYQFQ